MPTVDIIVRPAVPFEAMHGNRIGNNIGDAVVSVEQAI